MSTVNDRLKLLVVSGSLNVGGAETQLVRLLPRLNREIFDVRVAYYTQGETQLLPQLENAGIPVINLAPPKWGSGACLSQTLHYLRQEQFDIVHAWLSSANHYGLLPALLARVPVRIGGLRGKVDLQSPWKFLYPFLNLKLTGWIVNSGELKDLLQKKLFLLSDHSVAIVYNGVETETIASPAPKQRDFYTQLRSAGRPVIGIVARLTPVKNLPLFLKMAKKLTNAGVDADYWIIGEGPQRSLLEQLIVQLSLSERVRIFGFRPDVPAALANMDIGVLTSDSESCPNSLLEMMCAGLPLVSTRCCTSLDRIIEPGQNGYLVDVGDADALADQVVKLLASPEEWEAMGQVSQRLVNANFSFSAAVQNLEKAYINFTLQAGAKNFHLQKKLSRLLPPELLLATGPKRHAKGTEPCVASLD